MKISINLTKFQEYELKELIPAFGNKIDEVVKTIIREWLVEKGSKAINYNNYVKEIMRKQKLRIKNV